MAPLLLVGTAYAHPSAIPHLHPSASTAPWIAVAWILVAGVWAAWALRAPAAARS